MRSSVFTRAVPRLLAGIAGAVLLSLVGFGHSASAQPAVERRLSLQDALQFALRQNPNTLLQQQQVTASRGLLLQAQSQFDPVASITSVRTRELRALRQDEITALQSAGIFSVAEQSTDTTTHRVGVDKTLVNGIAVGAAFSVAGIDDSSQRVAGIPTQTSGRLSFSLNVPLLRNAGAETVGAQVAASDAELAASLLDLLHTNSQTVFNTALAYWDTDAKRSRLDIALAAEKRAIELVDEMRKLIAADHLPAAEIELVIASRAEKTVARVAAEQALLDARHALARQLGLSSAQMAALPVPGDPLPNYDGQDIDVVEQVDRLIRSAIATRADLDADRKRELAGKYRLTAARNNLKPQLDLNFNLSYAGLAEGAPVTAFDRALFTSRVGPAFTSSLILQWPFGNSLARGNLLSQSAAYDASIIRLRDLEASIASNVSALASTLKRSVEQLVEGREAVKRYAVTLQNQLTKRRLGSATLLDVINVEDRLNNALLNEVQLQQNYANAIVQLRFELGYLVHKQDDRYDVRIADLLTPEFPPRE